MVGLPRQLIAGDTWQWEATYTEYPSSAWTATAYFADGTNAFNVGAVAEGLAHRFTLSAVDSAEKAASRYFVQVRATSGSESFTVETGWVEVTPNPAVAGVDPRSWSRRTLEAIEAFLEGNATTAQSAISIGGRSISRWSLPELIQWRDRLRAEVAAEEQGSQAGLGRNIKVRFGRA
jgi:hypothetical protein